jgi:phosphoribosylformylglycinamidine synthase subunit PurS
VTEPGWLAEIQIMLKPSVNDPQGLSIRHALAALGFDSIAEVRAGKLIQVRLHAADRAAAEMAVERMCAQLLANPVIETYAFTLADAPAPAP